MKLLLPSATRGRFLKKLPPGPPQKLLINLIGLRAWPRHHDVIEYNEKKEEKWKK
jgi:hypothetical protein